MEGLSAEESEVAGSEDCRGHKKNQKGEQRVMNWPNKNRSNLVEVGADLILKGLNTKVPIGEREAVIESIARYLRENLKNAEATDFKEEREEILIGRWYLESKI
jgi:hypothetical protein